ncbi:MAG TPA: tetraacyldisaccharide 4'-kinase [Planctomycetes bacterium]|nr:tetraacyldisaccharide 4'-kinase [Planctomycetota bacterium]
MGSNGDAPGKRRPDEILARRGGWVECLRVPAALFGLAARARGALFDRGVLRARRVEVPVLSIGNLTAGGTGKTPFAILLTRALIERGWRPGLLSRGYAASKAAEHGAGNDEARMLARKLGDVPHVQNPDRVAGAAELVALGVDAILLDDGFQHRRLARDLDFVLVDATRPYGLPARDGAAVRAFLPRGLLRESPGALRRADAVVLTRADAVADAELARLREELYGFAPGIALLTAAHLPVRVMGPDGGAHPSALRGREVDLVSGIGNPDAFEDTVVRLGARVRTHRRFPDHHDFAPGDLDGLGGGGRWLVTTEKDVVKLGGLAPHVRVLEVELELLSGRSVFDALLDALVPGRGRVERAHLHEGLHG